MLRILQKEIDLERSPLLYESVLTPESLDREWRVHSGEWWLEDGWLTGRNPGNFPGMVFLRGDYPGNVLVDFEARTVPPSSHDINFMWNGSWDAARNERGVAYVAGLQGWWEGKVGIEKSPDYKLNVATPLFDFHAGQIYHLQGGSIDGHCFLFVDGRLLLEVTDPEPIDAHAFTQIGFEAYCSHIQIRRVQVRQLAWQATQPFYAPEF